MGERNVDTGKYQIIHTKDKALDIFDDARSVMTSPSIPSHAMTSVVDDNWDPMTLSAAQIENLPIEPSSLASARCCPIACDLA
jgi:hypothetical protein